MGFLGVILGWESYFKDKFEDMLEVIKEGFQKQNVRISRLEAQKPVVKQYITQNVSLNQEQFNKMLKKSLESNDVLMSAIKREVSGGTQDTQTEVSRQLSGPRQTLDRQTQTLDRQARQDRSIAVLTQTETNIINILYKNDSGYTYSEIAKELGKSESNIRDKVNSIKKKTNFIVEKPTSGNRKCFALTKNIKRQISIP